VQAKSPGDLPGGHGHCGTMMVSQPAADIVVALPARVPMFFDAKAGLARRGSTRSDATAIPMIFDISISLRG